MYILLFSFQVLVQIEVPDSHSAVMARDLEGRDSSYL